MGIRWIAVTAGLAVVFASGLPACGPSGEQPGTAINGSAPVLAAGRRTRNGRSYGSGADGSGTAASATSGTNGSGTNGSGTNGSGTNGSGTNGSGTTGQPAAPTNPINPATTPGISDADLAQIDQQLAGAANALVAAEQDANHNESGDSTP